MIAAANVAPDFSNRRRLVAEDLVRLEDPACIFEHEGLDADGERFFAYSIAGWLDGVNVATMQGGATVAGDVMVVHARNRAEADELVGLGLQTNIDALRAEKAAEMEALAARARLASIGAIERINHATRPDKSPAFVADTEKLRGLIGDDIVLAAGKVA